MYERWQQGKKAALRGAALALALVLCTGGWARAAEPSRALIPVGHTVGIKLFSRGVMVVKLSEGGTPAKACGLRSGDVIVKCGGRAVDSTEQFQALLQQGQPTDLEVKRGGRDVKLSVQPQQNQQGQYSIGAWVRDSMAGIGTVTYYDPETGAFGALGHGITDVDTALLMPFSSGSILPSTVKAVKKGVSGGAGELRGDFDLTRELGVLTANTDSGVFGVGAAPESWRDRAALPVAALEEVCVGPATILANVSGDAVEEYDIQIAKVMGGSTDGRDMVISVTDPRLIDATGGIVQGMSGSPILQNGKLVGAVTHVLLSDPQRGYGISMETMLGAAQ